MSQIDRELAQQLFIHEQRGDLAEKLAELPEGTISELARKGYLKVEHEWGETIPAVETTDLVKGMVLSPHTFASALKQAQARQGAD